MYAMYPNGDGDISRDQVLHEHVKNLAKIITPNHKYLRIPKVRNEGILFRYKYLRARVGTLGLHAKGPGFEVFTWFYFNSVHGVWDALSLVSKIE